MIFNKVVLICSELWRLKRRHFSKHRDGSEEVLIDKVATLLADEHAKKAGCFDYGKFKIPLDDKVYIQKTSVEIKRDTVHNIQKLKEHNKSNFKHCLNFILEQFFIDNPEVEKINLPKFKYKNESDTI